MSVGAGAVRLLVAVSVLSACAAGSIAACFPSYAIGGGAGDGGLHDGTTADATPADAPPGDGAALDADATSIDAPGTDGAAADGSSPLPDVVIPPWDGSVLATEVVIDGGTFQLQVTETDGAVVDAQATLDYDFAIDRTEVTVERFQAFLAAKPPLPEAGAVLDPSYPTTMTWDPSWNAYAQDDGYADGGVCNEPGGKGPTFGLGGGLPMNCVPWEQALFFCVWDHGRRLPTDTEWRVVATSGGTKSPYPWGSQSPDCSHAIFNATSADCNWPVDAGSTPGGVTAAGVYDIVGSLSEWVWDRLDDPYLYPAVATDYAGPAQQGSANSRYWVGGSYWEPQAQLRVSQGPPPGSPTGTSGNYDALGFRCVRSLH